MAPFPEIKELARKDLIESDPGPGPDVPIPPLQWPVDSKAPENLYLLEQFRFDGDLSQFAIGMAAYLLVAEAKKWTRLLVATAVTGNPGDYIILWRVPAPYPPEGKIDGSEPQVSENALRECSQFFDHRACVQQTVTSALHYNPDPATLDPPPLRGQVVLLVKISVRDGYMQTLAYLKEHFFVPFVEKNEGWELLAAGSVVSRTGPASTIIQCWRIQPEQLIAAMGAMASMPTYLKCMAPCILREDQDLYSVLSGA